MEQAPVPRAHATRTQRRLSLAMHTALRNRRKDWAGALLFACAPPALAIGPGAITGPVNVTDGSEQVVVSGTTVTSTGSNTGANVTNGTLRIDSSIGGSGAIRFITASGNALQASGTGQIVTTGSLALTTTSGHAVLANGANAFVSLTGANIVGSGVGGGLIAIGGRIDASDSAYLNNATASNPVLNGQGAIAESGGRINLLGNVSIESRATQAVGLGASGAGSVITVSAPTLLTLSGGNAMGVYLHDGGQLNLPTGFNIRMSGTGGVGVTVDNTTATLASGLTLDFPTSPASVGTTSNSGLGVIAVNNADASFSNLTVQGPGLGAGVWALSGSQGAGGNTSADATVRITGNSRIALGDVYVSNNETHNPAYRILSPSSPNLVNANPSLGPSFQAFAASQIAALRASTGNGGGTADAQALIVSNGTTITVPTITGVGAYAGQNGAGDSRIELTNNTITTTGTNSRGLMVISNGTIDATGTTVNTSGGSAALRLETFTAPGVINLTNSTVRATGANTRGISSTGLGAANVNRVTMSGGTLSSQLGNTLVADGLFDMAMSGGASVASDAGFVLYSVARTTGTQTLVNLGLTGNSRLRGNAYADAGAETNISLADRSQWNGAAYRVTDVTVDASSQWTVTADSLLTGDLRNTGVVAFAPPVNGNFKRLATHNYFAGSGTLAVNTFLDTDGSPSDVLIIDGGQATTGTASLMVANAGGAGALTSGDGILVIDAVNGGITGTNAFALGSLVLAGAYEYTLQRGSRDGSSPSNWYLRSTLDCTLDPSAPGCDIPPDPPPPDPDPPDPDPPDPPPTPPDPPEPPTPPTPPDPPVPPTPTPPDPPTPFPPVPNYRAEVSLYAALPAMALRFGWTTLGNLHERVGEEEQLRDRDDLQSRTSFNGAWVRVIAEDGDVEGDRRGILGTGPKYEFDVLALQIGTDVWREQHDDDHRDHAGLYVGQGRIKSEVTHYNRLRVGKDKVEGTSLGGYWTHFWPCGSYVDTVLQGTWSDMESHSVRGLRLKSDSFGWAASVEGGMRLKCERAEEESRFEPQAQIVYQRVDDFEGDDVVAQVRFREAESLAARLGVRWARDWRLEPASDGAPRLMSGWLRANVWHEFKGEPLTLFSSGNGDLPFQADISGTWWQLNAGMTRELGRTTSLYANIGYQRSFGGNRFDAWDGKLGLRWNW
ncbi:autotransporter outer membrane beta-barrel domain-containing protein [Lysobacter soli]|uniref:Autotransporter outer membrane beta-barrel domain-containing protein n=2 Tax=Lysobacter soli TaxID=453783 RepID=A0A3D8VAN7_9GAMM|nr:autotransporter outer membrane beta-barrel domain-containing protein [Lysobacter soli]